MLLSVFIFVACLVVVIYVVLNVLAFQSIRTFVIRQRWLLATLIVAEGVLVGIAVVMGFWVMLIVPANFLFLIYDAAISLPRRRIAKKARQLFTKNRDVCPVCLYDLRGNRDAIVCSECGWEILASSD